MRTTETDLVGALLALDKAKDGRVSYEEFQVDRKRMRDVMGVVLIRGAPRPF